MKKLILPTLLVFVCFFILGSLFPTNILAENKDCLATWNSERYACAGAYRKCYEQCGAAPGIAPDSCYKSCDNTSEACKKEADANFETCKNTSKNKTPAPSEVKELQSKENDQQPQLDQAESNTNGKPAEQSSLVKDPSLLSIGYKWVESLYLNKLAGLINEFEVRGIEAQKSSEFKERELLERKAGLTDEMVDQYKNTPYQIDILNGQAQIKLPGQNNWSDLRQGDKIPPGSTVFTGMDTTTVLTIANKGVVQIAPFSEVIINESGLEQATLNKELFNDIEINKGGIEVSIESGVFTAPILDVHMPNATTSVRGTHFWVSYKDNQTVVGVYEGKVEVKTKDGRVQEIIPNGDQPGVMVISQKLSPVKLGIAGVVLAAVLGGVIMILRRKFAPRINKKKK